MCHACLCIYISIQQNTNMQSLSPGIFCAYSVQISLLRPLPAGHSLCHLLHPQKQPQCPPTQGTWTWLYRWAVCTQGQSGPTCLFPLVTPSQAAQERGKQPRGFAESAVRDRTRHSLFWTVAECSSEAPGLVVAVDIFHPDDQQSSRVEV